MMKPSAVVLGLTVVWGPSGQAADMQGVTPVSSRQSGYERLTYDEFAKVSRETRLELFEMFSPEKRAQIVRTHLERWRERNRERLTQAELEALDGILALVTADLYRAPLTAEKRRTVAAMKAKAESMFVHADFVQAFRWIGGPSAADEAEPSTEAPPKR